MDNGQNRQQKCEEKKKMTKRQEIAETQGDQKSSCNSLGEGVGAFFFVEKKKRREEFHG
jgi:hypothetical protein